MVTIEENAQKFAYLAQQYPKHNLEQLIAFFQLPQIEMNAAIWRAEDLGYIKVDKEKGTLERLEIPNFTFGEEVVRIEDALRYSFNKLSQQQTDLDDYGFGQWCAGYPTQNLAVAMKRLMQEGVLATYEITDKSKEFGRSDYTFYTMAQNLEHKWGRKSFKNQKQLIIK